MSDATEAPGGRDVPAYADLLALALPVAVATADMVRQRRRGGVEVAATKSSPVDIVTAVDRAAEQMIFERLMAARPADGFIGEEGASTTGSSGVEWVVDPIDGTVNFLYGIPSYAVSIAATVDGRTVAGVVVNVATQEVFSATLGGGAHLDGSALRVAEEEPAPVLAQRLVATGFNYLESVKLLQTHAVSALLREVRDIRRIGAASLDLCNVASRRVDAYVEEGLNAWDVAAGGLVATEAGAVLERHPGVGGTDLYLCAPRVGAEELRDLVARCGFLAAPAAGTGTRSGTGANDANAADGVGE